MVTHIVIIQLKLFNLNDLIRSTDDGETYIFKGEKQKSYDCKEKHTLINYNQLRRKLKKIDQIKNTYRITEIRFKFVLLL